MMRRIWIIMFLFLEAVQISANDNSRLYQILDSLIEQYDQLTAEKERRVATIKEGVRGIALTPEQQYDLNQRLYDEYVAYKFDSAFYYIDKNVTAHDLQQIADGIQLEDGEIKADDVQYASPTDKKQVGIEIHSGKNRIVRRIFESLGYRVQKLDRVQFAGLTKKNLKRGDWRYLTEEEVDRLRMGAYE